MKFLKNIEDQSQMANHTIGGKAHNLHLLDQMGMRVPRWLVIPQEEFAAILPSDILQRPYSQIKSYIDTISIPESFIQDIVSYFPNVSYFSVRSSAVDEDAVDFSFAGQFESFLYVTRDALADKMKKVWQSAFSDRVYQYRKNNNLGQKLGIAVIIQEMVNADSAGVAFGINPRNGDRNENLICAVYGLGEGLVSGELNSDNYFIKADTFRTELADKSHKIVFDEDTKSGTTRTIVPDEKRNVPCLSHEQIMAVVHVINSCQIEFGKPQDIEFAFQNEDLYILQSRPITNLQKLVDRTGEYIVWDNSNIVESYPGVTTPLTFSFISKSYKKAYTLFCEYMGVNNHVLKQNEQVFDNTLGLINGRVYYNLKSWYHMLAMLPGYSINARFMETMMGVKEKFDIPEEYRLSKTSAWWSIFKMATKMYGRFRSLPRKRNAFMNLVDVTISEYKQINYSQKNVNELLQLYRHFENTLLNEWKAPLINDFFAMIWFGLLQKRCKKYGISKNPNIHNDLLCGSNDIISIQPIHRTIAIASKIAMSFDLRQLFITSNENNIWNEINNSKNEEVIVIKKEIERYITDFGERCIGELKLETISYTQDPRLFIKILKSYVETGITIENTSGRIEQELSDNAEKELNFTLSRKPLKKLILKRTLRKARELVSARENLRYERTRAFGIIRELFTQIGKNLYADNILDHPRDIFYLTKEEIFSFVEGTSVTPQIKLLIQLRKQEFDGYKKLDPPAERFASYGAVYHANDFFSTEKTEVVGGDLIGVGCCPGKVQGKVRVVLNPEEVSSLHGDILVTSSTDPGWVTLFPSAAAIIVERGSLLSHSAIVSREMGKPCIVGVTGLLKRLKTGDEIEMDGSTGEIKIVNAL